MNMNGIYLCSFFVCRWYESQKAIDIENTNTRSLLIFEFDLFGKFFTDQSDFTIDLSTNSNILWDGKTCIHY